jgi:hypothetical protein
LKQAGIEMQLSKEEEDRELADCCFILRAFPLQSLLLEQ